MEVYRSRCETRIREVDQNPTRLLVPGRTARSRPTLDKAKRIGKKACELGAYQGRHVSLTSVSLKFSRRFSGPMRVPPFEWRTPPLYRHIRHLAWPDDRISFSHRAGTSQYLGGEYRFLVDAAAWLSERPTPPLDPISRRPRPGGPPRVVLRWSHGKRSADPCVHTRQVLPQAHILLGRRRRLRRQ